MEVFPRGVAGPILASIAFTFLTLSAGRADALLPHRVSYDLSLDASRPSQTLESANGHLDYEITGGACSGYTVNMRQFNLLDTGEEPPVASELVSSSWEDERADSYRFKIVDRMNDQVKSQAEGQASRTPTGVKLQLTRPNPETVELKGHILMPTEHMRRVIAAAQAGETTLAARVFDGSEDGRKVYSTLAVIGHAMRGADGLPASAQASLAGQISYPVNISYFDDSKADETPDYVMTLMLYTNGVIGRLKIDYGDFVLKGVMASFEAQPAAAPCDKPGAQTGPGRSPPGLSQKP